MFVLSYCGYCSTNFNDKRILSIKDKIIECTNCHKKTKIKEAIKGENYYCLERIDQDENENKK